MNPHFWKYSGFACLILLCTCCEPRNEKIALIRTDLGDIRVKLYDSTPLHRDNFIKLVKQGHCEGLIFHRVVRDFLIEGGRPESKNTATRPASARQNPAYTVPAEIGAPPLRGALAAAGPENGANHSPLSVQPLFFIVQGSLQSDEKLDAFEKLQGRKLDPRLRERYKRSGGAPHLDGQYAVFGEVISGMEVVDRIGGVPCDGHGRPLDDIRMTICLQE